MLQVVGTPEMQKWTWKKKNAVMDYNNNSNGVETKNLATCFIIIKLH